VEMRGDDDRRGDAGDMQESDKRGREKGEI